MRIVKLTLTILVFATSLMGNELRLQVGGWMGDLEPELEKRFFIKNFLGEYNYFQGIVLSQGQITTGWSGKSTLGLYPVGIQYLIPSGNNKIVIGANLSNISTNFSGNIISSYGFGTVKLENYTYRALDLDLGIQLPADKISIIPKIGIRNHNQKFTYNETIFENFFGLTSFSLSIGNNSFEANADDMYLGIDLDISLDNNLSLVLEYTNSSFLPNLSGNMSYSTTKLNRYTIPSSYYSTFALTFITIEINNRSAKASVDFDRFKLGIAYNLSNTSQLEFGLRQETQKHSYKNYSGFPILISNLGVNMMDIEDIIFGNILANAAIWNPYQDQKKGLLYFTYIHKFQM